MSRQAPVTPLNYAERWLRDGLQECGHAGAFEAIEVDVTAGCEILKSLKAENAPITWTHIFVRAAAMVLTQHPELHRLVAGNSSLRPATVDICLSIAGDASVTPVLIIEDAANKDLLAIAAEVIRRTPEAREESRRLLELLQRWGWLVPFSSWRRSITGFLLRRVFYRRKVSGTFQVTCLPQVDLFAPLAFNTAAALGVGRVKDRVVAVNGQVVIRPVVILYCSIDHAVWNGMAAATFLTGIRSVLESGDFWRAPLASTAAIPVMETLQVATPN